MGPVYIRTLCSTYRCVAVRTGSRVDGLAVASQSRALYYTDSHQNEVVMMSLDGKSRKVLRSQNLSSPRAIVLDETSGLVAVGPVSLSTWFTDSQ